MTTDEMMALAGAAADKVASTVTLGQRIFMPAKELRVLLMDAYARGVIKGCDLSVEKFAPQMKSEYLSLAGRA